MRFELLGKRDRVEAQVSLDKQAATDKQLEITVIPMERIFVNPEQPRKIFSAEELKELSSSIRAYGVLQPILVRPQENGYMVIAGERRFRASQLAGLTEIPAIVRPMEEEEAALVALVENLQRENLHYIEEARAYQKLMDDFHLTQSEIAQRVGKQQSTISNKIRILSLPEEIQILLTEEKLTERHARALLRLTEDTDRKKVMDRVIHNHLNVKQTEKLVEEVLAGREAGRKNHRTVGYISYKIYVNTLRKAFQQIQKMEENAIFEQEDRGDHLAVTILIPKSVG